MVSWPAANLAPTMKTSCDIILMIELLVDKEYSQANQSNEDNE
jgi:hypothetical protein